MELKDFISETILQIAIGVMDAAKKCKEIDVIVNPEITVGPEGGRYIPKEKKLYKMERRVQQVDMDICVTVSESENTAIGAKVGISVLAFAANSTGNASSTNVNRVSFSIPVCLPVSKEFDQNK